MTKRLKLSLPLKDFDRLFAAADGRGEYCRVKKSDLTSLLMDHSRALALLGDEVDDDYQDCSQVRKAKT